MPHLEVIMPHLEMIMLYLEMIVPRPIKGQMASQAVLR
jgi:hypothetical protein